jgi:hypothetical protein
MSRGLARERSAGKRFARRARIIPLRHFPQFRYARLTSRLKPMQRIVWQRLHQAGTKKIPAREWSLRRQIAAGESLLAGSSRALRLDPRSLPVRFAADDASADGRIRLIEIDRDRVLLTRSVRGVRMRLNLPLENFLGVAVRLIAPQHDAAAALAIVLEHPDENLSVPLHVAEESGDLVADWQLWGAVLRKRLLVADGEGLLREPFETVGAVALGTSSSRRLRRTALGKRRPKIFRRRVCARTLDGMPVHSGEREIIARS